MSPHLTLAHQYWKAILTPGDRVIDATCGNGYDTLYLTELGMQVIAYDIQEKAIETTRKKVPQALYHCRSHASFLEKEAALIVYNLGYLPGSDKTVTTTAPSTLESVSQALEIASKAISIMCYPGHPQGAEEEQKLLKFLSNLDRRVWQICYHQWLNRRNSPSFLWIYSSSKSTI